MGMYDNIEYEANCLQCGNRLSNFQSKDGPCRLENLKPNAVDSFYTNCEKCSTRNHFTVERECTVKNIIQITEER